MQYPFVIQHHEENKRTGSSKGQMVIDLYKSGNGYKKIHKQLNIPLSTVRAIIKNSKGMEQLKTSRVEDTNAFCPPG